MQEVFCEELDKVNDLISRLERDKETGEVSVKDYENAKSRLEQLKRELESVCN